jgi:proteasome lid subunit RPN8/RPN11
MRVIVDKDEERKFRRRALSHMPNEYMEVMYGYVEDDTLVVCAFVDIDHEGTPKSIAYDQEEIDRQKGLAEKSGLVLLGTIHTHPDREEGIYSECDARDSYHNEEKLFAICSIHMKSGKRRTVDIWYWPGVTPLEVEYRETVSTPEADRARERRLHNKARKV